MSDKIKIDTVTGGKSKDKLKGCYFLPSGTAYDFYDKNNNLKNSGVSNGSSFSFPLDTLNWTISNLSISATQASGDWTNDAVEPTDDESGTFQAQSGGGGDPKEREKDASAASA